jgi:hypothetical protein
VVGGGHIGLNFFTLFFQKNSLLEVRPPINFPFLFLLVTLRCSGAHRVSKTFSKIADLNKKKKKKKEEKKKEGEEIEQEEEDIIIIEIDPDDLIDLYHKL